MEPCSGVILKAMTWKVNPLAWWKQESKWEVNYFSKLIRPTQMKVYKHK